MKKVLLIISICCIIIIICETIDPWITYMPPVSHKPAWLEVEHNALRTVDSEGKLQTTIESNIKIHENWSNIYFKPSKPNIVLLLDVSPSMQKVNSGTNSTSRLDHLREAVDSFLNQISNDVDITIITFSSEINVIPLKNFNSQSLKTPAKGATNVHGAFKYTFEYLIERNIRECTVILFSDGNPNEFPNLALPQIAFEPGYVPESYILDAFFKKMNDLFDQYWNKFDRFDLNAIGYSEEGFKKACV